MPPRKVKKVMTLPINVIFRLLQVSKIANLKFALQLIFTFLSSFITGKEAGTDLVVWRYINEDRGENNRVWWIYEYDVGWCRRSLCEERCRATEKCWKNFAERGLHYTVTRSRSLIEKRAFSIYYSIYIRVF